MSDAFVGEIRMFAGSRTPQDWHDCDGTLLPIQGNEALFSLIGVTYGGDARTNFGLPDLRGRVPIGAVQGGPVNHPMAQAGGAETVALTSANMPPHNHQFIVTTDPANQQTPANAQPATVSGSLNGGFYSTEQTAAKVAFNGMFLSDEFGTSRGAEPHNNVMPSQVVRFIIALQGVYPDFN